MSQPDLSVVIPAYNEEKRLPPTLHTVVEYLRGWGGSHEIVVVDDGSTDRTADCAREAGGPALSVVSNPGNRGKGFSVRRGMLLARGRHRLMTDADLSTPMTDLPRLLSALHEGYAVAVGSRALATSNVEVHQSAFRESMGRFFNLCVRLLVLPGLHDTQCGFKLFREDAARDAFGRARLDGFSFDVEALFVARKLGYRIAEVPVTWRNDEATRVRTVQGALAFLDLLRIRGHALRGHYAAPAGPLSV